MRLEQERLARQEDLERRLRTQLVEDGSAATFSRAYDQFHDYLLRHGDRGKGRTGHIYQGRIGSVEKTFLRLVGSRSRILEVGMGGGDLCLAYSRRGHTVVGMDISRVAVLLARHKSCGTPDGCLYLQADGRKLSFPSACFDFVVSKDFIEHLREDDVRRHLQEIRRVLRPGGKYLLWTPPAGIGHSSLGLHLKEWTLRETIQLLQEEHFNVAVIPLHLIALGCPVAIKSCSWCVKLLLRLEALAFTPKLRSLIVRLPLFLRSAIVPSACIIASNDD